MRFIRIAGAALLLNGLAGATSLPNSGQDSAGQRPSAISLRKRLHVNPLITEPDTIDLEWGGAFSTGGDFTLPAAIHFTPRGPHPWWGRTEFSASFDSLS